MQLINRTDIDNLDENLKLPVVPFAILCKQGEMYTYFTFKDLLSDDYRSIYFKGMLEVVKDKIDHLEKLRNEN